MKFKTPDIMLILLKYQYNGSAVTYPNFERIGLAKKNIPLQEIWQKVVKKL